MNGPNNHESQRWIMHGNKGLIVLFDTGTVQPHPIGIGVLQQDPDAGA